MKYNIPVKLLAASILVLLPHLASFGQSLCGFCSAPAETKINGIPQHTGCHLPAEGRVRGLLLFVRTGNDDLDDNQWPLNDLPLWASRFSARLTNYFKQMSNGRLDLELDTYSSLYFTHGNEWDYVNTGRNLGHANRDMLQALDQTLDFSPYDNWQSNGSAYNVKPGPDKKVDLIITIYRRVTMGSFFSFSGISDLGFSGWLFVDSGDRRIYGGSGEYNDASSSGVTIVRSPGSGLVMEEEWAYKITIHELMHKFFGEGHPADLYGGLGVLSHGAGGLAMSAFERHTLGYIDFMQIPSGRDTTIFLRDYVTTGDAALLPLPQAPGWHYAFEYRRRISPDDSAPAEGVYVYRIYTPAASSQRRVQVISADGAFQWGLDSSTGRPYRLYPDPIGGQNVYQKLSIGGKTHYADGWWGEPRSAFNLDRPNFTPWHNPSPDFIHNRDTIRTDLFVTMERMDEDGVEIRIRHRAPAILAAPEAVTENFTLFPVYPHPLTNSGAKRAALGFELGAPGFARLKVMDSFGRIVTTVVEEQLSAGRHIRFFDAHNLPSGVYRLTLEVGSSVRNGSFVIAR